FDLGQPQSQPPLAYRLADQERPASLSVSLAVLVGATAPSGERLVSGVLFGHVRSPPGRTPHAPGRVRSRRSSGPAGRGPPRRSWRRGSCGRRSVRSPADLVLASR